MMKHKGVNVNKNTEHMYTTEIHKRKKTGRRRHLRSHKQHKSIAKTLMARMKHMQQDSLVTQGGKATCPITLLHCLSRKAQFKSKNTC